MKLMSLIFFSLLISFNCASEVATTTQTTIARVGIIQYQGTISGYDGTNMVSLENIEIKVCNNGISGCNCADADSTKSLNDGFYLLHSDYFHLNFYPPSISALSKYYLVATDIDGTENGGYFNQLSMEIGCGYVILCSDTQSLILNSTDNVPGSPPDFCDNVTTTTTL